MLLFEHDVTELPFLSEAVSDLPSATDTIGEATHTVSGVSDLPQVPIGDTAAEATYSVSVWIMRLVDHILGWFGVAHNSGLVTWVYAILVFLIAMVVGFIAKYLILWIVRKIGTHYKSDIYGYLLKERFFIRLSRIIPAVTFLILIQFAFTTYPKLSIVLTRITWIWITLLLCVATNTFIGAIWEHFNDKENKKKLPLNGIAQLLKGIVWIIAFIISVAIGFDKSPASLLAGLGAFSAVLMLIFKDQILGVVAGVQLAQNDSLHVGDWVAVPNTNANGNVTEVSLTAIKIQNWDKTTTMVPPYSLITNGFTNYQSMSDSNTRRIQRSYMIDADSVVAPEKELLDQISKVPYMAAYIEKKRAQAASGHVEDVENSQGLVDGTLDTNLGLFRAYLTMWLNDNPLISHADTCFVTTLQQTNGGIPLQVYCFTATSAWISFEHIQAGVFEHIAAALAQFHLYTFENASGRDTILDGYMSNGRWPSGVLGVPYPFFLNSGTPFNPGAPVGTPAPAPQPATDAFSNPAIAPAQEGPTGTDSGHSDATDTPLVKGNPDTAPDA